jgi:predicted GNAT family N-acyltransferase
MDFLVRFASSAEDRDAAYALRKAVFEEEQQLPRVLDRDALDFNADHVVAFDEKGRCVGTCRMIRTDSRTCQIGRIAVAADQRRRGVAAAMLSALERMARLRGISELAVASQLGSEPFFRDNGYARAGEVFQDSGVPHVPMRKNLVTTTA